MRTAKKIHKHSQATDDLLEIFSYLALRSETSARLLLQESRKAFELILSVPGIGSRWETPHADIKGLRSTTVSNRFREYVIFYRQVDDGIQIVTVVHGARDLLSIIDDLKNDDVY